MYLKNFKNEWQWLGFIKYWKKEWKMWCWYYWWRFISVLIWFVLFDGNKSGNFFVRSLSIFLVVFFFCVVWCAWNNSKKNVRAKRNCKTCSADKTAASKLIKKGKTWFYTEIRCRGFKDLTVETNGPRPKILLIFERHMIWNDHNQSYLYFMFVCFMLY